MAQLDPAQYKAHLASDRADLVRSQADVLRVAALLKQAERDVARQEALVKDGLVTQQEYDAAIANRDSLVAQGKVSDASVEQMQAALTLSEVNLQYCTITSPVDGVVVSRNVDVGQTVAASLSAPTLFVIAADLEKMQVQASVAEADIGKIVAGQVVTFDVDAYAGEKFEGTVSQVRIAPTTVQNVVTYSVIVDAPNPKGRLLPGMTANLSFELERHDDVLMVNDSALRFTPPEPEGSSATPSPTKSAAVSSAPSTSSALPASSATSATPASVRPAQRARRPRRRCPARALRRARRRMTRRARTPAATRAATRAARDGRADTGTRARARTASRRRRTTRAGSGSPSPMGRRSWLT